MTSVLEPYAIELETEYRRRVAAGAFGPRPDLAYRSDPIRWMVERMGVREETLRWSMLPEYENHQWDGTKDPLIAIADALVAGKDVGVESGTGTGKTRFGALLLQWYLAVHKDGLVVTLAPKGDQLRLHIWKEIGRDWQQFSKRFPQAQLLDLGLRMRGDEQDKQSWAAVGFPVGVEAGAESATKAQGFHADRLLFVFEETPGIPKAVMTAVENTCTGDNNQRLAFGNPDHCFVAGTMIQMPHGARPIEEMAVGNWVDTRYGYRRVMACGLTSDSAPVFSVQLSNGRQITGTGNHPVYVLGTGFRRLDTLHSSQVLIGVDSWLTLWCFRVLRTVATLTQSARASGATIGHPRTIINRHCTERSGLLRMALSHTGMPSIISTGTPSIIPSTISPVLRGQNTVAFTSQPNYTGAKSTPPKFGPFLPLGMGHQRGWSGIGKMEGMLGRMLPIVSLHAKSVGLRLLAEIAEKFPRVGVGIRVVTVSTTDEKRPVYNLSVEGDHEYFADGVLVHNCNDSLHEFCTSPGVSHIRISAYDHPNVVCGRDIIPGAVTRKAITRRSEKYGQSGRLFQSRVRGISPLESASALIRWAWCQQSLAYATTPSYREGPKALGVDVANSEAGDKAAIARGVGRVLLEVEDFQCPNANQLGRDVLAEAHASKIVPELVGVDSVGVGAGTVNVLHDADFWVHTLNGGAKPAENGDAERFLNLRSQQHWQMREDLQHARIVLPDDPELWEDLTMPTWETRNGKIVVESKEDIKKRLGRSPNKGDAAILWNWVRSRYLQDVKPSDKYGDMDAMAIAERNSDTLEPWEQDRQNTEPDYGYHIVND